MYSKLVIIGNLGKAPEMRYLPNGTPVTNLSVATNRTYKNGDGEKVTEVTWYRVNVFGKMAEACAEYLDKGRLVCVEGTLIPDKKTGGPRVFQRSDGTPGATFEVRAEQVKFLGGGNHAESAEGSGLGNLTDDGAATDAEIPF